LSNNLQENIRCIIYRNEHKLKRVTKGVYLYLGADTADLILHNNTDHPWLDNKAHTGGN